MTLEQAIRHSEEVAERYEKFEDSHDEKLKEECLQCAEDHRQLAEWLRELLAYRKIRMCGNCRHYVIGTTHFGECHVTSDIKPELVSVNQVACDTFFDYKDFEMECEQSDT